MWALYISKLVWRFVVVSPAINIESRQVFFWELGCFILLQSCKFNLKLPCPLSPPSFSQISFSGMTLCHVSPSGVLAIEEC